MGLKNYLNQLLHNIFLLYKTHGTYLCFVLLLKSFLRYILLFLTFVFILNKLKPFHTPSSPILLSDSLSV